MGFYGARSFKNVMVGDSYEGFYKGSTRDEGLLKGSWDFVTRENKQGN